MHSFLQKIRARATDGYVRKILLPEVQDERIQEAAKILLKEKIAEPIFFEVEETRASALEKLLLEVRASKVGTKDELTREKARELAHDSLMYGAYLLRLGEADGLVAGVSRTSADVIRAGLWVVGKAEGIRTISSSFYMVSSSSDDVLTFTDCAVVPEPTSEQLADIAIAAADARSRIVGDEPRIALLSYSTKGSGGAGESILKVRKALELIREKRPQLIVDGEMQADAALNASISERKAPGNALQGKANVLVFPSLDAGNIGYKLVVALSPGVQALGPVLQGMAKPMSDLSRGASVEDIVNVATIVASQAGKHEPARA